MSSTTTNLALLLLILGLSTIFQLTAGHGILEFPPQRGATNPSDKEAQGGTDTSARRDFKRHFPAGDRDNTPGAAKRYQARVAGPWLPFEPMKPGYIWRAGVCGDLKKGPYDHMLGGKYYTGKIFAYYKQGDIIPIKMNIITNHGGFAEFHVCDVAKCGGEISEECFKNGFCYQLQRAANPKCDDPNNHIYNCLPIDAKYPGRWYFPCSASRKKRRMGGEFMLYHLPKGVTCKHCVLHWYWAATNQCHAPGMKDYFTRPGGPIHKGVCPGNGWDRGEFKYSKPECVGSREAAEEYLQCADISISP